MNIIHFLEYIQVFLDNHQIDLAKRFLKDLKDQLPLDTRIATLDVLLSIHEIESQNNETSFFMTETNLSQLETRYEMLKFYLRRLDFDIPSDDEELINFIIQKNISSSAILIASKTSMIHPIDVLNKVAMILSEYNYMGLAVKLLYYTYENSKDDTTLFNFSLVLWKLGSFDDAKMVLNQISTTNDDIIFLTKLINEKVKYNEQQKNCIYNLF